MASTGQVTSFAAQQVKFLRKTLRLSLERLADASGLSMVMVEKAESGRHKPDEQALRAIARATGVDADFFVQPATPEEERRQADIKRDLRQMTMIVLTPLHSAADVMRLFEQRRDYRLDVAPSTSADARAIATQIIELIRTLDESWGGFPMAERLAQAGRVVELCAELAGTGHDCWAGELRRRRRVDGRGVEEPIGLIGIRPEGAAAGVRFAIIRADGDQNPGAGDNEAPPAAPTLIP